MSKNPAHVSCIGASARWRRASWSWLARSLLLASIVLPACRNFAVVEEGRVYRSAQPDAGDIRDLQQTRGIKSVLNLRGESPDEDWYVEEKAACEALGIALYSSRWSSIAWPEKRQLLEVLDAFGKGPYPMLIHCRVGADRTGLASAIYLITMAGVPVEQAADQLTSRRGHFGTLSGTGEMDEFLELYATTSGGKSLRAWVEDDYERERDLYLGIRETP
ncbi:MAG: tyrosine-protein phosphatase [Planctomycetota bacterium]